MKLDIVESHVADVVQKRCKFKNKQDISKKENLDKTIAETQDPFLEELFSYSHCFSFPPPRGIIIKSKQHALPSSSPSLHRLQPSHAYFWGMTIPGCAW